MGIGSDDANTPELHGFGHRTGRCVIEGQNQHRMGVFRLESVMMMMSRWVHFQIREMMVDFVENGTQTSGQGGRQKDSQEGVCPGPFH